MKSLNGRINTQKCKATPSMGISSQMIDLMNHVELNKQNKEKNSRNLNHGAEKFLTIISFVLFILVLLWSASGYYYSADDPAFIYMAQYSPQDVYKLLIPVGRWLNSFLIGWIFSLPSGIADLALLRTISALLVLGLALLLALLMVRQGERWAIALAATMVALLNPSTIVMITWAQHITVVFGAILVTASAHLLLDLGRRAPKDQLLGLLAAALMTYAGTSINQTLLGFWGIFVVIFAFYAKDLKQFAILLSRSMLIVLIVSFLAYITVLISPGEAARTKIALNFWEKASWFFSEPLPNAASLLTLYYPRADWAYLALCVALMIVISTTSDRLLAAAKGTVFLGSLFLCYTANLLVSENWASYRTIWALSIIFPLVIITGISILAKRVNFHFFSLVVIYFIFFVQTISWVRQAHLYFREPLSREAAFFVRGLASSLSMVDNLESTENKIFFIIPHWTENTPGFGRYDDFATPQTRAWTAAPLVNLVSKEIFGRYVPIGSVEVVNFDNRSDALLSAGIVLDMSNYAGQSRLRRP